MPGKVMKQSYRIVTIYLVVGIAWIFFSDALVSAVIADRKWQEVAQTAKGWGFVLLSAGLLFALIRSALKQQREITLQLAESYERSVDGWIKLMDLRHKETHDHTLRVTTMTVALAKVAGITSKAHLHSLERGAMLHDIGKIGVPDHVLTKPGKYTPEEWQEMAKHPEYALELLKGFEHLCPCVDIPYCHHEHWDGSGYPRGLKGEAIPYDARLFAVVDVWDSLISERVYKKGWPEQDVLDYIQNESGKHFDPQIAALFVTNYPLLKEQVGLAH